MRCWTRSEILLLGSLDLRLVVDEEVTVNESFVGRDDRSLSPALADVVHHPVELVAGARRV